MIYINLPLLDKAYLLYIYQKEKNLKKDGRTILVARKDFLSRNIFSAINKTNRKKI